MDTSKRHTVLVDLIMCAAFFSLVFGIGLLAFYENTTETTIANVLNIVVSAAALWLCTQRTALWDELARERELLEKERLRVRQPDASDSSWDTYDRAMDESYKKHYPELKQRLSENPEEQEMALQVFRSKCAGTAVAHLSSEQQPGLQDRLREANTNPSAAVPSGIGASVGGPGWSYCYVFYLVTGHIADPKKVYTHMAREALYIDAAADKARTSL